MSGEPVRCPTCGAPISAVGAVCPACLFRAGAADETIAAADLTMSAVPDQATRLSTPGSSAGSASTSSAGSVGPTSPTGLPVAIGPYRIVSLLGEGGMGVVYLAEQTEPIRRTVALKVIKLGMDTRDVVARFESERQALALMDHPNIARVIDAGATPDGRPFFVMEHVAGVPITDYCDANRLSTRARLGLLAQVCGAVQHAHQKGVIHRDLKPSNVLVGEQDGTPVPKIIDFGIAKATDQRLTERTMFTEQGQFIGTPEYMSPEQTLGVLDIDATTDIYALGVILYELLAGSLPFEATTLRRAGYAEMQRIIREDEPPKPSTKVSAQGATASDMAGRRQTDAGSLRKLLAGDLDWITLKALEKDRSRRYASASEFAADIGRYLNDEPVLASPPSASYRAKKFVRRHRIGVVASGLAVVGLLASIVAVTWMYRRAEQEASRNKAESQAFLAWVQDISAHDVGLSRYLPLAQRALALQRPFSAKDPAEFGTHLYMHFFLTRFNGERFGFFMPESRAPSGVVRFRSELALELAQTSLTLLSHGDTAGFGVYWEGLAEDLALLQALGEPWERILREGLKLVATTPSLTASQREMTVGQLRGQLSEALVVKASTQLAAAQGAAAELVLREALGLAAEESGGNTCSLRGQIEHRLGHALEMLGRLDEAETLLLHSLSRFQGKSVSTATCRVIQEQRQIRARLVALYTAAGQPRRADKFREPVVKAP